MKQDFGSGQGRGKPLCMETYKNFFHSYRMPHEEMDRLLPQSRRSNHIVVASCNQFYILRLGQEPLEDPYRKPEAGSQLNETSIFDQLLCIYRISREHARRDFLAREASAGQEVRFRSKVPKVGLLTTENRKVWAKLHKRLSHCCGDSNNNNNGTNSNHTLMNTNTESLKQIEDCLFVMCLDSLITPTPLASFATGSNPNSQPQGREEELVLGELDVEAANVILTGAGSQLFTANRWFDKFLQIIVGRDGICGINIEHSASEGITVLRFLEEFLSFIKANPVNVTLKQQDNNFVQTTTTTTNKSIFKFNNNPPEVDNTNSFTSPAYVELKSPSILLKESDNITPLNWQLDEELELAIDEAEARINKSIENFSLKILSFTKFGRAFIKSQNLSPDAFIQLAMQLTYYKLHGTIVSTYESASLRQFRLGRVDNIRANTCEAFEWIKEMIKCNANANANESKQEQQESKYSSAEESFQRAITKQVEILRYTIGGAGPDNHMLALKQLARIRYDQDELPDLFTDPSFKEYSNFQLSTSQLPNNSGITVGYGAVVPNGYGCSYNPCENRIVFCIASFHDCLETDSGKFADTLQESLLEMQQLCLHRSRDN